jgi:hypothetical protein
MFTTKRFTFWPWSSSVAPTPRNRIREIESWFHDHADGEFMVAPSEHRSSVVGDGSAVRTVIYTTKVHCLEHKLHALDVAHPVMIVGRYGLPASADLIYLDAVPVDTRCSFLGDADPPDILAFAWLREHTAPEHWTGDSKSNWRRL